LAKFVGTAPPSSDRGGLGILRAALVSGAAFVMFAGSLSTADAQRGYYGGPYYSYPVNAPPRGARYAPPPPLAKKEKAEPKKDPGFGDMPKGPLQLVVSIGTQKVTLFSNGVRVAQGPVSTGVPGHPTPMGVFSVIEKDRHHRSNIYSGAPMPYMQRITWSGVALHEGVLPGHPASHGCIRMSHDFAAKLWPITRLGVRVIVTRNELEPVEFSHPKLFSPKLKPEPKVAMRTETNGLGSERPIRLAQATSDTAADTAEASPRLPDVKSAPGEESKAAESAAQPAEPPKPIDDAKAMDTMKPAEDVKAAETTQPGESATTDDMKATGALEPSRPADAPPTLSPDDLRKSVETTQPIGPAKSVEAPPAAQAAPAEAAPGGGDAVKPAPTEVDPMKPAAPRLKADQPPKRSGQVAVFVSRKEKKIFVRQGMIPLFDMPVVIEDPDQPLGVHVFTAMAVTNNGEGMRWNLFTVPNDTSVSAEQRESRRKSNREPPSRPTVHLKPPSTAAQALNRIEIPKEAIDRIGELLIPGSSLVIADDGLGRETGRYTEFIVLTR
jgi:L,D-transpeptidase-like protein